MKRLNLLAALAVAWSLSGVGCISPAEEADEDTATVKEIESHLQQQMTAYANALLQRDVAMVELILSADLRARIEESGLGTAAFVDKERAKLIDEVGEVADIGEGFVVTDLQIDSEHGEAGVELSFGEHQLLKPFPFVLEDGVYRYALVPPVSVDRYRIDNTSFSPVSFSCPGGFKYSPANSISYVSCQNSCGWFHGTNFQAMGQSRLCDWNSWGYDAKVYADHTWKCHDAC